MTVPQPRRRGAVRRTARWAANVAILAVVVACAAWILPGFFGLSRYVITGGSMSGTYDKGSVVFEKPVQVADLRVGDVITYLPPPESGLSDLVTHRIVDLEPAQGGGTLFTTKGDANASPDPWQFRLVDSEQPVVQYGVPYVGWAFIGLADREIRMLVVGGPAAVVAVLALLELAGAVRSGRRASLRTAPVARPPVGADPLTVRLPSQRTQSEARTTQDRAPHPAPRPEPGPAPESTPATLRV
jgi:signal peptidase I